MCRKEPGMKINRVTLYNFSSYVGENTISLDTHDEQNIILIGGNNGAGKTSFFTAIKLALYGPQCFRFQDKNNRYTARIKELINHDAFLSDNVKAYVEVEIDLPTDRVHTLYTIRREWSFIEKRLQESYTVYKDHQLLADKNLDFFQNYLFSIISPNLFDFFFFDGEEIGDFFATGKALVDRLRKALLAKAKDRTAHEFTSRISQVMQRMISDVTKEKFHQIESLTLEMFNKIIRKENFVQLIELDDNFNVNLYKKQTYITRDLLLLANNIGLDALEKRLGSAGLKEAAHLLTNDSIDDLRRYFSGKIVTDQISFQDDIF